MSSYFKSSHVFVSTCTDMRKNMSNKYEKMKTVDSPKVRKESYVSKPLDTLVKTITEKETVDVKVKHVKIESDINPLTEIHIMHASTNYKYMFCYFFNYRYTICKSCKP